MDIPEYVTVEEVQRVCKTLGIRDWTDLQEPSILAEEADCILAAINVQKMPIGQADFRMGLEVELEHGLRFSDANVTNNHPLLTGKIVLAHLKETLDYYQRIDIVEIEADLFKAICAGDLAKAKFKYQKLNKAKLRLHNTEQAQLG